MLNYTRDDAYQRHRFRVEVEHSLQDLVTQQHGQTETASAQIATLREGFGQLGLAVSGLEANLAWSMEAVAGSIEALADSFSWGLAEIAWQQEQANELLGDVLKALRHPRHTQAEEFRQRGDELYKNALASHRPEDRQRWMELALQTYKEAEAYNPADFSVIHSAGVILFFEKGKSEEAARYFREAATLAEPYSKHHAAMSWLYLGYVLRNRKDVNAAYAATSEAVTLDVEWSEAQFQHAVSCVLAGRIDEMKEHLVAAINSNPDYFPKAALEPEFLSSSAVRDLLNQLHEAQRGRVTLLERQFQRVADVLALDALCPYSRDVLVQVTEVLDKLMRAQSFLDLARSIPPAEIMLQNTISALPLLHKRFDAATTVDGFRVNPSGRVEIYTYRGTQVGSISEEDLTELPPDPDLLAKTSEEIADRLKELGAVFDNRLAQARQDDLHKSARRSPNEVYFANIDGNQVGLMRGGEYGSLFTEGKASHICFSSNSKVLAAGDDLGNLYLWQVADQRLVRTWSGHKGYVNGLNFFVGGLLLVSSGADNKVIIWPLFEDQGGDMLNSLVQWANKWENRYKDPHVTEEIARSSD